MSGTHTEHSSRGAAGTPRINPEAEAQRIERLGLGDLMSRVKYVPSEQECRRILNVSSDASLDDARARFRALSRAFHPDSTLMSDKTRAAALFAVVQRAWEELEKKLQEPSHSGEQDRPNERPRPNTRPSPQDAPESDNGARDRDVNLVMARLRSASPEVLFLLCDYLRKNILRTAPTILIQPERFVGREGALNRATASVAMFDLLKNITVEAYYPLAGAIVSELERSLAPSLGVRDWTWRENKVHAWAGMLGLPLEGVSVIRTTVVVIAQCETEKGTIHIPSIHDGALYPELEPWMFSEHVKVLQRISPTLCSGVTRLTGSQVPIAILGPLNSDSYLKTVGIRVCASGVSQRSDTQGREIRDMFDGIELRPMYGRGTSRIVFNPAVVRSVTVHLDDGRPELIVEYHPAPGELIPPAARYDLSALSRGDRSATSLFGEMIVASNTRDIGVRAAPLTVHHDGTTGP
jgi:hypothetical protein